MENAPNQPTPPAETPAAGIESNQPITSGPAPAPAEAPQQVPASEPVKAKKSKAPLIIVIIVVALLLIGGGVAAYFLIFRDTPEKSAMTASSKFFDTLSAIMSPEASDAKIVNKNLKIDGKVDLSINGIETEGNIVSELSDNGSSHIAADFSVPSQNFSVGAEGVNTSDKEFYFKLDGLNDIYKAFGDDIPVSGFDVEGIIKKIDKKWFSIDLDEALNNVSNPITYFSDEDGEMKKITSCVSKEMEGKLTDLVKIEDFKNVASLKAYENENLKPASGYLYTLDIDVDATNELYETLQNRYADFQMNAYEVCGYNEYLEKLIGDIDDDYADYVDDEDNEDIDEEYEKDRAKRKEELKKMIDQIPTIYVEVNKNKEISRIYGEYEDTVSSVKVKASFDFNLSYPASISIEAPKNAKPFNEIVEEIKESITDYYVSLYYGGTDILTPSTLEEESLSLSEETQACMAEKGFSKVKTYDDLEKYDGAYDAWWDC